jgi:glycosyltransferase involved in cell wall biosynthesis
MKPLRVAVVYDFAEENWPSMDLVGNMLVECLAHEHAGSIEVAAIRPRFVRRVARAAPFARKTVFKLDRLLNRFIYYPKLLRSLRNEFDLFHIVDHSYSHLVHDLPEGRAVVGCHDLDAFRCILQPERDRRSWPFRAMTRRILEGFKRAARVSCGSDLTRAALLTYGLGPARRLLTIRYGINPACSPHANAEADNTATDILGLPCQRTIELLHVGSTVARKRIDVLLHVFAGLRKIFPATRLVRVGGPLTTAQLKLAEQLRLADSIVTTPFVDAHTLAAIYRRAALLLMPSEAEGFGLPIAEAMACGTPVLATDMDIFREVAGDAVEYAPSAEISAWIAAAALLLDEREHQSQLWCRRREAGLARAALFSWSDSTARTARLYRELVS